MSMYGLMKRCWRRIPDKVRGGILSSRLGHGVAEKLKADLATHDEIYDAEYYQRQANDSQRSAAGIAASIFADYHPRTVLDVGCGSGNLLAELAALGVQCRGIERSTVAIRECRERGLEVDLVDLEHIHGLAPNGMWDVIVCTEVAEHLPASVAEDLVAYLCASGPIVVFTAASPGQGGSDHVNERPPEYWIRRFVAHGCCPDMARVTRWREDWTRGGVAWWYSRNLMVFRKCESAVEP